MSAKLTSQRRISPHEGQEGGSIGPASAAASFGWRNGCASPGEGVDSCRQRSQIGNPGQDDARQKRSFDLAWSKFQTSKGVMDQSVDAVFRARLPMRSAADRVVRSLGWQVVEDFREISALSEMCLGVGAMKLLRGQYERVVTASYLSLHPEEAQDFLHYFFVQHRRLRNHAARIVDVTALFPTEKAETGGTCGLSPVNVQSRGILGTESRRRRRYACELSHLTSRVEANST